MSVRNSNYPWPFKSRRSLFLLHLLSLMLFYIASSISVDLLMDNHLRLVSSHLLTSMVFHFTFCTFSVPTPCSKFPFPELNLMDFPKHT